jgi:hypothetical protein
MRMRWAGHVGRIGNENLIQFTVGKSEGKGPLGRPKRKWEDNIKMEVREVGVEGTWNGNI